MIPKKSFSCPKKWLKKNRYSFSDHSHKFSKWLFPVTGLACLIWFLIRVIPKPSRAQYPCMKVAAPIASSFLLYVTGLAATIFSFKKARQYFRKAQYPVAVILFLSGITVALFMMSNRGTASFSSSVPDNLLTGPADSANHPMGMAKGIFPGRVVWVHNPDATNENCIVDDPEHGYFMSENIDQAEVDRMLSASLQSLAGQTSDSAAWDAIFRYHNTLRGKGAVNYVAGEKIFIKTNATSAMHVDPTNLTSTSYHGVCETSVAPVLAVLRQLVNVVGVAQSDIYVGDPIKHIYKHLYDIWHLEFPDVHYLDHDDYSYLGREQAVPSTTAKITYSDKGTILRIPFGGPVYDDYLYTIFEDAEYILNIPVLKGHQRAGMTMFAKNHFGSHTRDFASHLHNGLVSPEGPGDLRRIGYGLYRIQVDIMSHDLLGGKNLVYIMDALWASDWELHMPVKWNMPPFNNDYTSSIFVSLDPVAIESVGYDFLRSEFTTESGADTSVQMWGVDDYLHQAADSVNWPQGIRYDPNHSGVYIASLGVHEHWNNLTDKEYTRNLGTGDGIELIDIEQTAPTGIINTENNAEYFQLFQNYPNPFNPATTINYVIQGETKVKLEVFDILGRKVVTLVNMKQPAGKYQVEWDATGFTGGIYLYRIVTEKGFTQTKKLVLLK
jgi:hypothetical protein